MNDLEARLRASFQYHLDELRLPISPTIVRKARRVRLRSIVGLSCLVLAVVAFTLVGVRSLTGHEVVDIDDRFEVAGLGERSYVLDGFRIEYPYNGPSDNDQPDPTYAGVTYVSHWATGEYPGEARCDLSVFDATGHQVGSLHFRLDNATDGSKRRDLQVPVSKEPVSADAACTSGDYLPGAGYIFDGPIDISPVVNRATGEEYEDRLQFTFEVRWEHPGAPPRMRTCYLTVVHKGAEVQEPVRFDPNMGEGRKEFNVYVEDPSTVETAHVTCGDLEPVAPD